MVISSSQGDKVVAVASDQDASALRSRSQHIPVGCGYRQDVAQFQDDVTKCRKGKLDIIRHILVE